MKKNFKNIIIQNPMEYYPIQSKPIIQTTIINSPKIISSKNHVVIKQYINNNNNEKDQLPKDNYLYNRNIRTENKTSNFKSIFNDRSKLVYKKQGLNYNNTNKNDSSFLNCTTRIFIRNKNLNNNNINNNININKTNYMNNDMKLSDIKNANHKANIESYTYLYPKQNINKFDNNINDYNENKFYAVFKKNNVKNEPNVKISRNAELFSNEEIEKSKTNRNSNIINYENEKSKTFEKIGNKKYKKRVYNYNYNGNSNITNSNINDNNNKTMRSNASELSLYMKKYPFRKQAIKPTSEEKEYNVIKNTYSNLYKEINNITLDNKNANEEQNDKFKKNNILEAINECNNNQICKKIVLLDKKNREENIIESKNTQLKHNVYGDQLSSTLLEKEISDISDDGMTKKDYSVTTSSYQHMKKNSSLPKTSFRFLINTASKDKQFGDSFHKAYETNKKSSIGKSIEKIKKDKNEKDITEKNNLNNNENKDGDGNPEKNNSKNSKYSFFKRLLKDKNNDKNILMNNLKVIKSNNIIKNKNLNKEKIEESNDSDNLSKTLNNFKINKSNCNLLLNLMKNKSKDNIFRNKNNKTDIIGETIDENEESNDFVIVSTVHSKKTASFINIELLYNLENKILSLIYKIKKYQKFEDESYDIINYYFKNEISKHIIQLFNGVYYKNIIISYIKTELLSYFLCYDVCFYNNCFDKIVLLIKSIINFVHNNFLLLLLYIINENKKNVAKFISNAKNKNIIYYLQNIIKQNISQEVLNDDINEGNIIKMIMKNVIEINKYYKLIIDNVYQNEYLNNNEIDNNLKFPYCLKYINSKSLELLNAKKQLIISSFFAESYQLLNNYSVFDLENFFYSFLDKTNLKLLLYRKNKQYILPKIDNIKYKYTLVLDLDETLIHCDRKSNNGFLLLLRPGLIDFLQKMKNLCELILFSFGTTNYVDYIIKVIEKKEKFFEYILDRNHGIYDNGDCIKDLDMLNRDLKNVIIIDDTLKYFKLHKENGICVKPFYGDIESDKNTLATLGNILEKIFYDANITKDVRISLKKYKKLLTFSNIINN